jgi:hypothetical protein
MQTDSPLGWVWEVLREGISSLAHKNKRRITLSNVSRNYVRYLFLTISSGFRAVWNPVE